MVVCSCGAAGWSTPSPLAAEPASLDYMKPYLQKEFLRSFPRSLNEIMQYNSYSTRFTVMPNLGCPLGMPGKRKLQLRNFLQQLACGHASRAFSGLLIDRGGPSPRWAVAPLGCSERYLADLDASGNLASASSP